MYHINAEIHYKPKNDETFGHYYCLKPAKRFIDFRLKIVIYGRKRNILCRYQMLPCKLQVLNVNIENIAQKNGATIVIYILYTRIVDRSDGVSSVTYSAQEQSITEANEMK